MKNNTTNTNKKLFLFDLDGTLLTDEKIISLKTREALADFTSRGNVFAICTGRPKSGALIPYRELQLDFPGSYIISYNGAQITNGITGEDVYRAEVPKDMVADLFAMGEQEGIHIHTYTDRYIVSPLIDEELVFYRRNVKIPTIINEHPLDELDKNPCKMIAITLQEFEKLERFRELVTAKYGDRLTVIYSNQYFLEIFPKEAGKGNALKRLAEKLDIAIENTMAAGDAENDISMIEAAGLGIAMCNGDERVKAVADIVTSGDNNHDGLVTFLLR